MTDYQQAVYEHMATAPEALREYVCWRLKSSEDWEDELGEGRAWVLGECPIHSCGFTWVVSPEKKPFWSFIANKEWQDAMATYFWQSRQQPTEQTMQQLNELEIGDTFSYGTGTWKIVAVANGKAMCERMPDVITLPLTQIVPTE